MLCTALVIHDLTMEKHKEGRKKAKKSEKENFFLHERKRKKINKKIKQNKKLREYAIM